MFPSKSRSDVIQSGPHGRMLNFISRDKVMVPQRITCGENKHDVSTCGVVITTKKLRGDIDIKNQKYHCIRQIQMKSQDG